MADALVELDVDARPLATTRILTSLAALVGLVDLADRFEAGFDPDRLHVPWPVVGDALTGLDFRVVLVAWGTGAVLLLLGAWSRLSAGTVAAAVGVWLLADRQHYANGTYLLLLVLVLLATVDSGASRTPWSRDEHRVPWWPVALLATQASIVYAFAAMQKVRPLALSGATIDDRLNGPLADVISWSGLPSFLNAAGGLIELFCALALWFAVTRRWAVVCGIGLHLGILLFVGFTWALLGFGLTMVGLYAAYAPATEPFHSDRSPDPVPSGPGPRDRAAS